MAWGSIPPGSVSIFACPSALCSCIFSSSCQHWVTGFRVYSEPRRISSQDPSITTSAKSLFCGSLSSRHEWGNTIPYIQYGTVARKVTWTQDEDRESQGRKHVRIQLKPVAYMNSESSPCWEPQRPQRTPNMLLNKNMAPHYSRLLPKPFSTPSKWPNGNGVAREGCSKPGLVPHKLQVGCCP